MEAVFKNSVFYISTLTASLSYCYFFSSKLSKGIFRFISLFPIFYLFAILPLRCSFLFPTAVSFSFTTWLTNFKLLRFAFDLDPSPFQPSDSLLRFITVASLPIKTKNSDSDRSASVKSSPERFLFKLGCRILIFSILASLVQNYRYQFHPKIVLVIYCVLLFLIIDIVAAVANSLVMLLTGFELEPSSNEPYFATSIQNFWGRWNLLVTNTLRHTIYKPVRLTFAGHYWAPHAGVIASFFVSGLMHELFVYQLSREKPTWEMTSFFMIHGICVVVEMIVKRHLAGRRWRLPQFVSTPLTVGFVAATGFWLFFPPLIRSGVDMKVLNEYESAVGFIKNKLISVYSF
ncbi:probable long-chain-alcohol O-fatty-acyltransferase 5 [Cynara cardunculus var. scolymus]|uniref:Wax synthase domain-containing protein n=1 Tax=Cynara cardunculus var. scolymus TaxID=59895 RepID=A0A103XYI6_CYNCS|nr:probable long-chain-alcohol O-fatty-acyltransferase 5 [Cynara cardunculus var. scolymus]KVH99165.1 hypothetical protein Ccrd_022598 [Cynara cardunculus var. scolymus]